MQMNCKTNYPAAAYCIPPTDSSCCHHRGRFGNAPIGHVQFYGAPAVEIVNHRPESQIQRAGNV